MSTKIFTKIQTDNLQFRKTHDKNRSKWGTTLISEIKTVGKNDGNRETTEDECIKVIKKFIKNARELYTFNNSSEVFQEIEFYENYLPKQMSEDELTEAVRKIIHKCTNIGAVMRELKDNYSNFDGKLASQIAMKFLKR